MRYYSTQRPVGPGTFPQPEGNKVLEIVNFDGKIYCKEPDRDCWGYIEYEKPLSEKEAASYELVRELSLDFSQRYMATSGTSILRTFATAAELNEWWEAQNTEKRYFCRLYDRKTGIDILGSHYMWLKPEERFHDDPDDPQQSLFNDDGAGTASPEKRVAEYIVYRCPDGSILTDWNGTLWKYGYPAYPKHRCTELERGYSEGGMALPKLHAAMKKKYLEEGGHD